MSRRILILVMIAFLAALSSCRKGGEFRHAGHLTVTGGDCTPCHGSDPAAPRATRADDCTGCHKEAKSLSPEQVERYAGKAKAPARRPAVYDDVTFSHKPHAEARVACTACHPSSRWTGKKVSLPAMAECTACHAKEGVSRECSTCHREIRKENPPPSHGADWEMRHGGASRSSRETCAICHEDRSCSSCHAEKKPRSHVGGWDKSAHGLRATEDRTACAVCHEAGFCNRCHSVPPPSHFVPNFRFSAHKNAARFNPRSCAVCHERSFCLACHPSS